MSRRGFTLLEILVALAILGIVITTVYGALARTLANKDRAEERAELYAAGREAVLKIADEIEGALPPSAGALIEFIGVPGKERVPADAVQFGTVVRRAFSAGLNRGGRALVSYSLDPVPNTPNLFALRRQEQLLTEPAADPSASDPAAAGPPSAIASYVIDQVAGLRLRYLDPVNGQWVERWDTTQPVNPGEPARNLPGAVEVVLYLADTRGGIHDFGTIVDLPLMRLPPTPRR